VFRFVCALILALVPEAAAAQQVDPHFKIEKLADGVYAAIRTDPPGWGANANNLFIIDADGVVVVDTNFGPSSTKAVLKALRTLTDKPVQFVINTHWHDDHVLGNQVYRDAFPAVQFIAHAATREYLPGKGIEARNQMMQGAAGFGNDLRGFLKSGKSPAGGDLSAEERAAFESDVAMIDSYVADIPSFDVVLPSITVEEKLTLYRGTRAVVIQSVGAGHTAGDLVVHLPAERILATGDLVVAPVPLVGGDQSHVASWIGALDRISAMKATTIVPGHGPVMHDDTYVQQMAGAFRAITSQVDAAVARGETLEQIQKSIKMDDWRQKFAGESGLRRAVFRNYLVGSAVIAAFREATEKR
jgi:cyclase